MPGVTGGTAVFPQTKFHRPQVRDEHVERSRLLDAIAASGARVVNVTAPAGFGKSTLLAQWAARCERVAWVQLDDDDRGPRLWAAVLTALGDLVGGLGEALDAAEAPDADLRAGVLIALLDALAETPALTLVLDDVHLVSDEPGTHQALDWVLARLPVAHQVLIASRRDPGLPALTRARMRGEVLDVRTDDLRFAGGEAQRFLGERLGLSLDAGEIAALDARTEGWPAALYLAALRLRLGDDVATVMDQLGDEDLFGALTDELLRSSPEHERRFIVETSVLDRFNASLCARLLGDDSGAFRSLTRSSLLYSPLDRSRTWFRCHHLVRDTLRSRLLEDDPARSRELHRRAGAWFESEGGESELHEAMRHYLAAREWDLAAELLARHALAFVQSGALGGRAREWLAGFPATVVLKDARLGYVSALLAALDGDRAGRDAWLQAAHAAGWAGPMPDGTASLELAGACLTALLCFDDLGGAVAAAREALAALPAAAPLRAAIEALTAWHHWLLGDLEGAERHAQPKEGLAPFNLPLVAYIPAAVLALVAAERGDLAAATRHADAAVAARDAGPLGGAPHTLPVTCAAARVQTLTGDPRAAAERCLAGLEFARDWRDSSLMVPATLNELARAHAAAGDAEASAAASRAAAARVAGARDAGVLAARPSLRSVEGVDELSAREVEVLEALGWVGMSLREIADQLFISRNTIKTHTRALYAKLGVASRDEAVEKGRALGLLREPR
jgi:LuxR family maltose regulon positive regulatory protein